MNLSSFVVSASTMLAILFNDILPCIHARDSYCGQQNIVDSFRWVSAADHITTWFTSQTLRACPALNMPSLRKPEHISVSNIIYEAHYTSNCITSQQFSHLFVLTFHTHKTL